MIKSQSGASDFYGMLADQCLKPSKSIQAKVNEKFHQPATSTIADLSRVQVRTSQTHHDKNQSKKRGFNEITKSTSRDRKVSSRTRQNKKKGESDDENASIHQDSYNSEDEKEGGASQNEYEADFIDDGKAEEKAAKQKAIAKKGQLSSEDEEEIEATYTIAKHSASSDEENDPYEDLPISDKESGFRLNKETNEYHLRDWFRLSAN